MSARAARSFADGLPQTNRENGELAPTSRSTTQMYKCVGSFALPYRPGKVLWTVRTRRKCGCVYKMRAKERLLYARGCEEEFSRFLAPCKSFEWHCYSPKGRLLLLGRRIREGRGGARLYAPSMADGFVAKWPLILSLLCIIGYTRRYTLSR